MPEEDKAAIWFTACTMQKPIQGSLLSVERHRFFHPIVNLFRQDIGNGRFTECRQQPPSIDTVTLTSAIGHGFKPASGHGTTADFGKRPTHICIRNLG